jgi:uncharacterized membrane protein YbhN (UPF0104 family)
VQRVLDAIGVFFSHLADVRPAPLGLAIACHLVKLACTSRAWRNVIVAAYPELRIPWRPVLRAYVAGVGVNAILPARGGDVLRVYLAHRGLPGTSYTTLVSTYPVMAIVDSTLALILFGFALTQGVLPGLDVLPSLPAFDFAWFFRHEAVSEILLGVLLGAAVVLALWARTRLREFWRRVGQAFAVLRTPGRYLRTVVLWQLADWALRGATIWFFLGAFGIEQSVRNVLLVQVTQSLATLVPFSPGGIGTEQAFLVYVFRGEVARTPLLAFSVGMKLTLTAVNVVVGFGAILLELRTLRFRRAMSEQGAGSS